MVDGKGHVAVNKLEAFINEVNALMRSGRLAPEEGGYLIEVAEAIIAQILSLP